MIEVSYGIKETGKSKFIFVAPHGAGDDINTNILAKLLAEKTNGSYVINERFRKYTSSYSKKDPDHAEDFNRLPFIPGEDHYDWNRKKSEMREFYLDLEEIVLAAKTRSEDNRAVIIHVHGMKNDQNIGIDIGIGRNLMRKEIKEGSKLNMISGKITLSEDLADSLCSRFNMHLKRYGLVSKIGENFNAQFRCFGIQYRPLLGNHILQLEICRSLREYDKLDETARFIHSTFMDIF